MGSMDGFSAFPPTCRVNFTKGMRNTTAPKTTNPKARHPAESKADRFTLDTALGYNSPWRAIYINSQTQNNSTIRYKSNTAPQAEWSRSIPNSFQRSNEMRIAATSNRNVAAIMVSQKG